MARTATTCTASYSGCLRRRSRPSPKGASSERVLRQKLLDTELRRRQRPPFFPLPDELAVGEQLRRLHRCPPRGKRRVLEVPMQTVTLTAGAVAAYPRPQSVSSRERTFSAANSRSAIARAASQWRA